MNAGHAMGADASMSGGGLSLGALCVTVFVVLLLVALLVLMAPARSRAQNGRRLDEVHRYRLLGAYSGAPEGGAPQEAEEHAVTRGVLKLLDRALRARGARDRLDEQLEAAGLRIPADRWVATVLAVVTVVAAAAVLACGSLLGAVPGALVGWLACRAFLAGKASRRRGAFEAGLPDALQLIAGALRSGFAVNQSITAVVREGTEPVAGEFARAMQEVRLGAELDDALDAVADRMRSKDMELVVMAMRTAREVGGNLAEVLQTTAVTMRERVTLRGQVRVLSAEGRLSAKVLTALPLLIAAYLYLFRRSYLAVMYTSGIGLALLAAGAVLLVVGSLWLRKLTKIEV